MHHSTRFTGEELVFGIEEGQVEAFLHERGYDNAVNMSGQELEKVYFTGANQGRQVTPIYAMIHAIVTGKDTEEQGATLGVYGGEVDNG